IALLAAAKSPTGARDWRVQAPTGLSRGRVEPVIHRLVLLAICGGLLSGCYESQDLLLDRDAARQPLAAGEHRLIGEDGTVTQLRFSLQPDGWYEVQEITADGAEDAHKILVNDLDKDAKHTAYAYATYDGHESAYVYGVLAVGADGHMRR